MSFSEHEQRLKAYIRTILPSISSVASAMESLRSHPGGLESLRSTTESPVDAAIEAALESVARDAALSPEHLNALEAIVLPKLRPVVDIEQDTYGRPPTPWAHLYDPATRQRLSSAIRAIGRVEVPNHPNYPYAGTGFLVANDLLMTNRHVAEIFATGLGVNELRFQTGRAADFDFVQEREPRPPVTVRVERVVMIHPYWDMALLRVRDVPSDRAPLTLATEMPESLEGREVVVIGYPAFDPRNDVALQSQIFGGVYYVKRLQPGRIMGRGRTSSYGNVVHALTHDSSTLGGNSGSAVIDVATGRVLGLHFAGVYLVANYAVPAAELARDARVVDAGVQFDTFPSPGTTSWDWAWAAVDATESEARPTAITTATQAARITIPLEITISIGAPLAHAPMASFDTRPPVEAPRMGVPIIHPRLARRRGYDPEFLGESIPMPRLTAAGKRVVANLDDDTYELKYHHFSVVMHKRRRLALFTAANVDWRPAMRRVHGRKPSRRELTGLAEGQAEKWVTDHRILDAYQLPDKFFTDDGAAFDKGHLVRRDDVCWGDSFEDMQKANGDTFHTTNGSPQTRFFNRSSDGNENWGDLENLVQSETKAARSCVLSGPVLDPDDPLFRGVDDDGEVLIQVPRKFWKLIVVSGNEGLEAFGFVVEQDLSDVPLHEEFAVSARWRPYLTPVVDIEQLLFGLAKLDPIKDIDAYDSEESMRIRSMLPNVSPTA